MARVIEISNGTITVGIAPDNGGMPVSIRIGDREILRTSSDILDRSAMMAGGCPVLFPFPSRTADDRYYVDGAEYGMPFHGLVKNASFGIRGRRDDRLALFITDNPAWLSSQYPFSFELELIYELRGDSLIMTAGVANRGGRPMFHALGWHPFFKASDKSACRLTHHCKVNYDYVNRIDSGPAPENMNLSQPWDHVLHTQSEHSFLLENPADGYSLECRYDSAFDALVVCTTQEGAVCIEPWCGIPDSANTRRMAQYVSPGETRRYRVEMAFKPEL